MPEALASIDDLKTAWKRVKNDLENRVFIRNPYSIDLLEFDLDRWLSNRLTEISEARYQPSSMFVCEVPKPDGLIRPGADLSFADRLIYSACVGACMPAIHKALRWSQGIIDFSYQLAASPTSVKWVKNRFAGWQGFRTRSIQYIDEGASYAVVADIAAFYENIHIEPLSQISKPRVHPRRRLTKSILAFISGRKLVREYLKVRRRRTFSQSCT